VADVQLGKMLDKTKNKGTPTAYLRNINVRWGAFDLSDVFEMRMTADDRQAFAIRDGDVMVCEGGEPGRAAVWRSGANQIGFQKALMRVRPADGIESDFLALYLRHFADAGGLEDHLTGTTIKHLPQNALRALPLPIPPSAEQRRIVAKLDTLTARTAQARADLDRIPALTARYKAGVLAAAFRGELTADWRLTAAATMTQKSRTDRIDGRAAVLDDLPQGWCWMAVADVAAVTGGLTKNSKRDRTPVRTPYLRVANVYANELRLDEVLEIGCTEAELTKTRLKSGDLLVVEGNGSIDQIGRVAIWGDQVPNCSHQNHLIRVRVHDAVVPSFALYWLLSPAGRSAIERVASSSSGLHTLSVSKVAGLPIPLCDRAEQEQIIDLICKAFAEIDRLAAEASAARRLLDRLDQAILAKAFRGELVPQDPADEPASALLERIRAERAVTPAARRGRKPKLK
jgi:type I restriction enzyme S subunit